MTFTMLLFRFRGDVVFWHCLRGRGVAACLTTTLYRNFQPAMKEKIDYLHIFCKPNRNQNTQDLSLTSISDQHHYFHLVRLLFGG